MMKLKYCPPSQVPYKIIVFVLAWTIIGIKMNRSFSKSMMLLLYTHINAADKNNGTRFFVNLKKLLALKVAKITRHIVKIVTINCAC